eukprot:3691041-Amphidinium_carterae.1
MHSSIGQGYASTASIDAHKVPKYAVFEVAALAAHRCVCAGPALQRKQAHLSGQSCPLDELRLCVM